MLERLKFAFWWKHSSPLVAKDYMLKLREKGGDGRGVLHCAKSKWEGRQRKGLSAVQGGVGAPYRRVTRRLITMQFCGAGVTYRRAQVGMQSRPACLLMPFMCRRSSRRSGLPGLCPGSHTRDASRLASNPAWPLASPSA